MSNSPRLNLPYVAPQQAQKHVTVNESLRRLDAVTQLAVASDQTTAEPTSPAEGEAYILPPGATGDAWQSMADGSIAAFQDGAWVEIIPQQGWRARVSDAGALKIRQSGSWAALSGGSQTSAPTFGVNATANTTNRLAVGSEAILFDYDQGSAVGDMRLFCNKAAASDTASFIFEVGHSGRAEFGLAGDEDFHLKISSNGSSWTDALIVDVTSGNAEFGRHLGVAREKPTDFWGGSSIDRSALWMPYGYFGSNGSYALGLWWNGYRNSSGGWTGQSINGFSAGAGLELQSGGCLLRHQDPVTGNAPALSLRASSAEVSPGSDNGITLGTASARWSQIYAASGTILTSDARDKHVDGALDAAERAVAQNLRTKIKKYRWKSAAAKKGAQARTHIGLTAQDVADAFAAEGLDPAVYGIWCQDAIDRIEDDPESGVRAKPTGEVRQALRYDELTLFILAAI
ncbi:MAG: DUF2793 domain-containing protein [Pseudomonadota bacterium]